jgi:2-methylcitrate dehydratase PrpD
VNDGFVSITQALAHRIRKTLSSSIPSEILAKAGVCVMDTVGCALGAVTDDTNRSVLEKLASIGTISDDSPHRGKGVTVWGKPILLSLPLAALYNGTLAHTLELDDVHRRSKVHAGAVVVPAALCLGQFLGSPGASILRAVVMGYEVAHRIGEAVGVREHRDHGWHCTSTMGVFGAATSAGILLELSEQQMTSALGLAGTQASGLWTFIEEGATNKRFHAGMAAHDGLLAAELAQAGLVGSSRILESSDGGLFRAMSSNANPKLATDNWGDKFRIEDVSHKIHASCRSTHSTIDAVLALRAEHDLRPFHVEHVEIETYRIAKLQCDHKAWPQSPQEARFNFRYVVSVVLQYGCASPQQFNIERLRDQELRSSAPEVVVLVGNEFERNYPKEWGSRVSLDLKDGRKLEKIVRFPKGDPENPLVPSETREKFISLAKNTLPVDQALALGKSLEDLAQIPDVRTLSL